MACEVGRFSSTKGATGCMTCGAGAYSPAALMSECIECGFWFNATLSLPVRSA